VRSGEGRLQVDGGAVLEEARQRLAARVAAAARGAVAQPV